MAITAAKLLVQVDANTSKAVEGLRSVENQLRRMAGGSSGIKDVFAGVLSANLVSSAISGFRNLAAEGLQAFTSYERLGMALQSLTAKEMLNSGAAKTMTQAYAAAGPKAKELLEWTQKLAIESPFTQDDVAQSFRMAQAYGFTTEEAKRLTTALIDFSAGSGATGETMQRVALALGQIQAKGKLAGQEVLQLVNAGVSVDAILAEAFGKSTEEIVEMREKGLIPADQAIQAIVQTLERDFGGAAARQSQSFAGLVSSLLEIKQTGLREFFTGTFEAIRPLLIEFVDAFKSGELQTNLHRMGDSFGEFVEGLIDGVRKAIQWWEDLGEGTKKLVLAFAGFVAMRGTVLGTLADIAGGLRGLSTALSALGVAGGPITMMITGLGLMGIAISDIIEKDRELVIEQQRVTEGFDELTARDWSVIGRAMGIPHDTTKTWQDYVGKLQTAKPAIDEAAEAEKKLGEAMRQANQEAMNSALQAGLSGELTRSMEEYQQALADLEPEHERLQARLDYLNVAGWIPSAEQVSKYANELMKKNAALSEGEAAEQAEIFLLASHEQQLEATRKALEENEIAQNEAAEAMRQATAEMIYQQAAAGLDAQASLELARAMGMISEQDYVVASSIQALKLQYDAMDGSIDGAIANAGGFVASSVDIYEAVGNLIDQNIPVTFSNIQLALEGLGQTQVDMAGVVEPMLQELAKLDPESAEFAALRTNITNMARTSMSTAQTDVETVATDVSVALQTMSGEADTAITDIATAFTTADFKGLGTTAGSDIVSGFSGGLRGGEGEAGGGLIGVTTTTITTLKKLWRDDTWSGIGKYMVQGLASGVTNNASLLADAVRAAVQAALKAAREEAGVNSPSLLFADMVGKPISEGIAFGIMESAPLPAQAAQAVVSQTAQTVYEQPINITAQVGKDIDMYELAMTVASMLRS